MVEQDAVYGKQVVGLVVVDRDPVAVELGAGIRGARIKRRGLPLRRLLHQPVELRGAGLIEAGLFPCRLSKRMAASSRRRVPRASVLAVYSGVSKETATWDCAARL